MPAPLDPSDRDEEVRRDVSRRLADEGESAAERRHIDRRVNDIGTAQSLRTIEGKLARAYHALVATIAVGTLLTAIFAWLGWKNQGPGSRIDALTLVVERNASLAMMRDSVMRISVTQLSESIRQTGYTACLMTTQGQTTLGSQKCAEQFLADGPPRPNLP